MLHVAGPYRADFDQLGLTNAARVLAQFAHTAPDESQHVQVRAADLDLPGQRHVAVFFKVYRYARPAWRYWGRRSKAAGEFANYAVLPLLGIRCAKPVAFGEQRDRIGRLQLAFVMTQAIPSATTLANWLAEYRSPAVYLRRRQVLQQLAEQLRRLHAAGRVHRDCFLRNVLVTEPAENGPLAWWIDCPHGSRVPFAKLRWDYRVKDLASLDRLARELASHRERLRFLRRYLGKMDWRRHGRRLAQSVQAYSRRRWG